MKRHIEKREVLKALSRMKVETGSLNCLGCGYEQSCSTRGSRVLKEAMELIKRVPEWQRCADVLPTEGISVLVIASGKPVENVELVNVPCIADYSKAEGWYIDEWPEWENPEVQYWMYIPDYPKEVF